MNKTKIKILLVEDNEGDIVLTKEALEEFKFPTELIVKRDGSEALIYLLGQSKAGLSGLPDLILLDINLPKKNGHEVLQSVKNHPDLKHIPIIILTTSSSEWDILNAYQEHCNCYIIKPVDINEFFKVTSVLEEFWINTTKLPSKS
ncbi:response regulator [Algoriphagus sp. AK58]|uniref:response regulator n=1 Tax=Algoriphagus sp. AK58 TaxID=1406877 RepID=UPI00164EF2CE|nr:response regulator [Algoriphagus sp. AK58]MBC6368547.1 response regulator [Algoriphagus sp. AK58]